MEVPSDSVETNSRKVGYTSKTPADMRFFNLVCENLSITTENVRVKWAVFQKLLEIRVPKLRDRLRGKIPTFCSKFYLWLYSVCLFNSLKQAQVLTLWPRPVFKIYFT